MADYEIDEPENLWEAIESGLPDVPAAPRSAKRPVILMWVKRSLAAAAMLAAVISLTIYFYNTGNQPDTRLLTAATDKSVSIHDNSSEPEAENHAPGLLAENNIDRNKAYASPSATEPSEPLTAPDNRHDTATGIPVEVTEAPAVTEPEPEPDNTDTPETPVDNTPDETEFYGNHWAASGSDNSHIPSIHPKSSGSSSISVSVYSSEGTGSALNFNSKGQTFAGVVGPDESNWEDNPKLGILLFNQGKDIKTDIKHRLPIRAGVSFTYNINDRLGIESGLSYTNLISDIKEGSESHYYIGKQRLHYIGIPVNLKYRVLSWRKFDLYVSGGMLAEKCISAKIDKEFVLNHQHKDSETEDLSDKPMQWSVNAAAGVQYNIISAMSIFVEPGISYYFDDGTDIPTIYKEKPANFNLNMGLRFTFGK